jgi:hypothetical protein
MAQATGWVEMPRDGFQDAHDGRGRKLHGIADEDKEWESSSSGGWSRSCEDCSSWKLLAETTANTYVLLHR